MRCLNTLRRSFSSTPFVQKAGETFRFEDSSVELGLNLSNLKFSSLEQFKGEMKTHFDGGIFKFMIDIRPADNITFFWKNMKPIFSFLKENNAKS